MTSMLRHNDRACKQRAAAALAKLCVLDVSCQHAKVHSVQLICTNKQQNSKKRKQRLKHS